MMAFDSESGNKRSPAVAFSHMGVVFHSDSGTYSLIKSTSPEKMEDANEENEERNKGQHCNLDWRRVKKVD